MKMKNKFLTVLLLLTVQIILGQERSATLQTLGGSGFHRIAISPEMRSASGNNLDHLRIFDSKKNEVPYRIFQKANSTKTYQSFEIVSKNAVSNKFTDVVILNKDLGKINKISLKIANTDVEKRFSISGSNDEKEWFGLVDHQFINNLSDANSTFVVREFSFPTNQYKFLKFTFIDKNSLPVNVLEAGSEALLKSSFTPVSLGSFTQITNEKKETKQTIIRIEFQEPQVVDVLKFEIAAPNYFLRNATVSVPQTRTYKRRTENYSEVVSNFQLKSKMENTVLLPSVFAKEFVITIENQDNPLLKIDDITLYQNPVSVLADLNQNEKYSVAINPDWKTPHYDLESLGIDLNQNFPEAKVGTLSKISKKKNVEAEKTFWQNPLFMWICIVVAIAIIGFFAIGLVKDMNKES